MRACIIILALSAILGAALGLPYGPPKDKDPPKKSCLDCGNEAGLWPICAIEFRPGQKVNVMTFPTTCKMEQYNCEHNAHYRELFAGACEGPNIFT